MNKSLLAIGTAFFLLLTACGEKEVAKPVEEQSIQVANEPVVEKNTNNAEDLFEQAVKAVDDNNYRKATELLEQSCHQGYAKACAGRGQLYDRHWGGIEHDLQKAMQWYEKACDGGFGESCLELGEIHEKGREVPESYPQAFKYYEKACNGDSAKGCFKLANIISHPYKAEQSGVPYDKDYAQTTPLYEKACGADIAEACRNLGVIYGDGHGVNQQDKEKAKFFYQKSCDLGDKLACGWYHKVK